jgi:hypothetical protein
MQNLAPSLLSALQFGHFILLLLKEKGCKKIQNLPEPHIGDFRKLLLMASSRRLEVRMFGLLGSRVDNDNAMEKYSYLYRQSRGNFPPIFLPNWFHFLAKVEDLLLYVAFLEITLKTRGRTFFPLEEINPLSEF